MAFPTNTVSLCSPSVQCRVDLKTKPLPCDICCLCPWLLPSGSPRSALLQPLGACTCFQSLSACSSKYKPLSLNSLPALCVRSLTVLCSQAVELCTLEGGVRRNTALLGTSPTMSTFPRKWRDGRSVLMEELGKLGCRSTQLQDRILGLQL